MNLASRMQQAQGSLFVGRNAELARFGQLVQPTSEAGILFVFGEMGSGKSRLMHRFATHVGTRAQRHTWVDARTSKPRTVIETAGQTLLHDLETVTRQVLFVDHFHVLPPEHRQWFLEEYLPTLPDCTLVVVADRHEPPRSQLESAGLVWPFAERMKLAPLDDHEAIKHLTQRQVGPELHEPLLVLARGVPLLLAVTAELALDTNIGARITERQLESAVGRQANAELAPLLEAPERRIALCALAVAHSAVHDLLVWAHDAGAHVDASYKWLSSLSFVEHTSRGLRIHAAARLAILGLLQQHHPSLLARVLTRVRRFYDRQLDTPASDYARWFGERLHLASYWRPKIAPLHVDDETHRIEPPNALTRACAVALTARRDGNDAASWIERWLEHADGIGEALLSAAGAFTGYALTAHRTHTTWPAALAADPAVRIVEAFCQRESLAFSPDHSALLVRSVLLEDSRCGGTAVSTSLTSRISLRLLRTPNVHFLFVVTRVPEFLSWIAFSPDFEPVLAGSHVDENTEHYVFFYDLRPRRRIADVPARAPSSTPPTEPGDALPIAASHEPKETERSFGSLLRARLGQLATAGGLTVREKEVLDLVVLDRNAEEIGKVLGISARTAKFHQARLLAKLGADSRMDLFRLLL